MPSPCCSIVCASSHHMLLCFLLMNWLHTRVTKQERKSCPFSPMTILLLPIKKCQTLNVQHISEYGFHNKIQAGAESRINNGCPPILDDSFAFLRSWISTPPPTTWKFYYQPERRIWHWHCGIFCSNLFNLTAMLVKIAAAQSQSQSQSRLLAAE